MAATGAGAQSAAGESRPKGGVTVSVRRAIAGALDGLRAHWGTAALAALTLAVALAAVLPVAPLATWSGRLGTRLRLAASRPLDAGFQWLHPAVGPADLRQDAVLFLFRMLGGVALGLVAVALLTLLALFVARAAARGPEIAVRRAIGASSRSLLAAQSLEGAALVVAALLGGGAAGLAAAAAWRTAWPGSLGAPHGHLGAIAVAALLAAVLLGALLPALLVRRPARSSTVDPTPLALVVPAVQLGLSLTVLAAAAMLRRGAEGVTPPVAAATAGSEVYEIRGDTLPLPARAAAYAAALRRLESGSPRHAASLSSAGALLGLGTIAVAAGDSSFYAVHVAVSSDTFRALRLRVLAGRTLTSADGWAAPRVAVVSRAAVFRSHVVHLGGTVALGYGADAEHTVVGVVDDLRPTGLGGSLEPKYVIYTSVLQHPPADADLLLEDGDDSTRALVRDAFHGAATLSAPASEAALFSAEAAPLEWFARAFALEGWAMLALATFGTFAVMWLWVTSLLGELGLRRAAGARRRDVLRYVLVRAAAVAAWGIAFGAWVGMMVWDAVHGMSATLPEWDPRAVAWSGLLLAAAALAGACIPAWRAVRTPPAGLISGADA